ncbi:TetR family transcriptional regulator [Streptomyces sp. BE133]|uniref:TetR family transcriptional regulator n=1 Tax=Streptomyces sp. BE133 TaxID=3002523 RepID=UPI002E76EF7A|nr:TetR family transcriptional regulator [Streptomyces sp. BE133]MEE1806808.1 TetR family transcriptional regulator [Streptomyces sp. BE133]
MDQPGLRERGKQRRREAITRAAYRLFAERGYGPTTIDDIAQAAEVARRTVTLYFPTKQDLALARTADSLQRLTDALTDRPDGVSTLDAVKAWLDQEIKAATELDLLEHRMFEANPELQALRSIHYSDAVRAGTASIARDIGAAPDDAGPALAAAAIVAVITQAYATVENQDAEQALRTGFTFLEAGIASLAPPSKP